MAPAASLRMFIARLADGPVIPRPEGEAWAAHVARISVSGQGAEIDEESYFYWLEVLPPKWMSGGAFAFAEGAEPLRVFWKKEDRYFARQLTWDETQEFCRLAKIPLPW